VEAVPQLGGRHVAPAVDLDVRLSGPAQGRLVEQDGEAPDGAGGAQAVHAPLGRRRGEAHLSADVAVGGPSVAQQAVDDTAIDGIHDFFPTRRSRTQLISKLTRLTKEY